MANVVRFTLSTARDLNIPGAGYFSDGVLDVDANNLHLVARTRYLVKPYGAVEVGIVDSATPPPTLPAVPGPAAPDPYPQYVTDADLANPASGPWAALRAVFTPRGETAQIIAAALPNLMTAIRSYDDAAAPTLRVLGVGSSVGAGATLPTPATQAPVARFGARLAQTINPLGNLHLATTNGSVNGSVAIDFTISSAYANAKTTAGGVPTTALFCYGMNDGFVGAYHQGQTFPGFYAEMKRNVQMVLNDGGDAVICTTPHPHTGRVDWTSAVSPINYPPGGVAVPAFTTAASVVTADWLGTGQPVPASARHIRINQVMRAVAAEMGVPLIDVERYWFQAVAEHGQDALFDTGEYAHPNLLGHQLSYWKAIDAFMVGLQSPPVSASVPRPRSELLLVKDSNTARTNTTTLVDDPQLAFAVGGGQIWRVEADVYFAAPLAGDLRVGLSLPSGATGRMAASGAGIGATTYLNDTAASYSAVLPDTYGCPVGGNGADGRALVTATIRTTTAGTVTMQFCQDTANGSATTIYANSFLKAVRVA